MFEEEKKKLEQRKKTIGQVEVSKDKLYSAVQSGFEKAKKEQLIKRKKIIKRSSWSIVIAAILLISFITSISVSPVFANKVAFIPGMERIIALIQQDRGLTAAVENDFYQPLNLSQEKNGITVTLDGVIADKKGMVVFYSVHSKKVDLNTLELKYLQFSSGMTPRYQVNLNDYIWKLTPKEGTNFYSGTQTMEKVKFSHDPSWKVGIKNGDKIEHFKIPFTYKLMDIENRNIVVDKEVTIEGQRIKIRQLIVDPIRTTVRLEEDPNNSKKLLSRAFDELKLVDEMGRTWSAMPGNSFKVLPKGNLWEVPLTESFYFHDPKELTLTFGKIAAMDKEEAHILIDTEAKKFLEQPSNSIFSNLQVEDNKVSFIVEVDEDYDKNMVHFNKFIDAEEKEFYIVTGGRTPFVYNYVKGSMINIPEVGRKFEFELPTLTSYTNPIRLDFDSYPSWIEEDMEIEVKYDE